MNIRFYVILIVLLASSLYAYDAYAQAGDDEPMTQEDFCTEMVPFLANVVFMAWDNNVEAQTLIDAYVKNINASPDFDAETKVTMINITTGFVNLMYDQADLAPGLRRLVKSDNDIQVGFIKEMVKGCLAGK